jgi:RimJ/RimL family protein N-acetyltransferase
LLRPHEEKDIEDVFEMASDPKVQEFLGGVKGRSETESGLAEALRTSSRATPGLRAIVHAEREKVIGYIAAQPMEGYGRELCFGLNSGYWGKGICGRAIAMYLDSDCAALDELHATVHPGNSRLRAVIARAGFRYIGEIHYKPLGQIQGFYQWTRGAAHSV